MPRRAKAEKVTLESIVLPDILHCPCCGEDRRFDRGDDGEFFGIYWGCTSAMRYGVQCNSCGLSLSREYPEFFPKGVKDLDVLGKLTLKIAIEAWNTRTPDSGERLTPSVKM